VREREPGAAHTAVKTPSKPSGDFFALRALAKRRGAAPMTEDGKPLALAAQGPHDPFVTKTLAEREQTAAGYFVALRQILSRDGYFPHSIRQSSVSISL